MSNNEKQIGVKVNEQTWQEFRQDVRERHGGIRGHLKHEVEAALQEYIDASHGGDVNDRLTRIEDQLDELTGAVSEHEEKEKDQSVGSRVEQRMGEVIDTIEKEVEGSPKVHEEVVEMAIREHAGKSDPTIRQYKRLLTDEAELFTHPVNDSLYFRDATDYTAAMNSLAKGGKFTSDEYREAVDRHGEEWWRQQLPDESGDDPAGFQ